MLDAEQCALDSGHPATAVRLTGIYGPGRDMLIRRVREAIMQRIYTALATVFMRMMPRL